METATSERTFSSSRSTEPIHSELTISTELAIENAIAMMSEKDLPVYHKREEVTRLIRENDTLILEAETGSGKSTLSPILALAETIERNPEGRVVVTQPRRVAAESLYRYLEPEMGNRVGFRHGGKNTITKDTKLEFTVERTLLNQIIHDNDPLFMRYDTVILDEVHERKVDLEILIPLLKQAQIERKAMGNPLKVILASATLDKEKIMAYQENTAHIQVEGRMFDVAEHYEETRIESRDVMTRAAQVASEVISKKDQEPGDILIFMPGQDQIEKTIEALRKQANITDEEIEIIPLMGGAESEETTRKIYEDSDKRRIYVATNVAETSITIPKVRVVIDSGLMKQDVYDPTSDISGLEVVTHTQSNAKQRKGRAGRTATGTVHYLFTREEMENREPFLRPEILRTNLVSVVFLMKQLGIKNIPEFNFLDHPGKEKINKAIETLNALGALNPDGSLSNIGLEMSEINAEPRFARMIVEAKKLGVEKTVALAVGMIQNARSDVFRVDTKAGETLQGKYGKYLIPGSDILTRLHIWNEYIKNNKSKETRKAWEADTGLRTWGLYNAAGTRKEILNDRSIKDLPINLDKETVKKITQSITAGLIDKLIVRKGNRYETADGTEVKIDNRGSVLSITRPEMFISGIIRRTSAGNFAGFNMEVTEDLIKKINPEFGEKSTTTELPPTPEISPTEQDNSEANQSTAEIIAPSQIIQNNTSVETQVKHTEEQKKLTRIQKAREWVRSWLKRLKIGKKPPH